MTVLRELIARLGFEVDKAGFQAAAKGVASIRTALGLAKQSAAAATGATSAVGAAAQRTKKSADEASKSTSNMMQPFLQLAATAGLSNGLRSMVELASDARETQNILGELFGPSGAAEVNTWSAEMADAMGRSKFAMSSFAGQLGAVIGPMVENREKSQEMSTTLAGLAVDLGSFFNATDEDAMRALRSGLTGEYESLKRFGVVLSDATLQEYARTQGIQEKVSAMSIAEKTELRYGFILKATKTAQGDAARTSTGFANASKALKASLKDLGTMMGLAVLPAVEKLIRYSRDVLANFKRLADGAFILKAAMYVLTGVVALLGLTMLRSFILPAVAVFGLIWAIDQLHALMKGGKSSIGDWLNAWGGAGTSAKAVDTIRKSIELLNAALDLFMGKLTAFDSLAAALPENSALKEWAQQQAVDLGKMRRPFVDVGLKRQHPRYGPATPHALRPPTEYRVDVPELQYSVLPGNDSVKARPRVSRKRAPAPAAAAGANPQAQSAAAQPPIEQVVNIGPTTININGDPRVVRQKVEEALDARDKRAMSALPGRE